MPNYIYTKPGIPSVIAEIEIESAAGQSYDLSACDDEDEGED